MTVTARVSDIDYKRGLIQVTRTDHDGIVSDFIPMLSHEYEMPKVGDTVSCHFTDDTCTTGFCDGRYFGDKRVPIKSGKDMYHKMLLEDADIEYNRATKELTITVENIKVLAKRVRIKADMQFEGNIEIDGDVSIKGSLVVDGSIHANGAITSSSSVTAPVIATGAVPAVNVSEVVIE